ncbi:hypothetical protein J2Y69_002280 [Microbacterium resistens]|uniref:Scaffolding protein n=1 Tax=Microbacterium resistens TaxID=156977 RepID=A0ABU1SDI3_9MICO|nr:hypothetical protein [Microbacterium resistens]MDR6867676.1 hypothetical protein [Microbacterium resistens]
MTDQIPPAHPATPAAPSPTAPPATPAPDAPASSTPPWGDDPSAFDPDKAWKLIENLRTDAEKRQEKTDAAIAAAAAQAQKDTLAQFAKLLSGEPEPETDPVKLAATIAEKDTALTAAQAAAVDAQRIAQVAIHGGALGANLTALLADPAFKTTLASVDPTKEADIKSVITQALQANAALKQPPRGSGDVAPTGPTVQSLEAQLKAAEEKKDQGEIIRLTRAIVHARNAQSA